MKKLMILALVVCGMVRAEEAIIDKALVQEFDILWEQHCQRYPDVSRTLGKKFTPFYEERRALNNINNSFLMVESLNRFAHQKNVDLRNYSQQERFEHVVDGDVGNIFAKKVQKLAAQEAQEILNNIPQMLAAYKATYPSEQK